MRSLGVAIAVVLLLTAATPAQSQRCRQATDTSRESIGRCDPVTVAQGTLTGTVVDEVGATLPGVLVTLTGKRTATTDKDGKFEFPVLPQGPLELRATLRGFKTAVWKVSITEKTEPLKIQMKLAKRFEVVFVGDTPRDPLRRR